MGRHLLLGEGAQSSTVRCDGSCRCSVIPLEQAEEVLLVCWVLEFDTATWFCPFLCCYGHRVAVQILNQPEFLG